MGTAALLRHPHEVATQRTASRTCPQEGGIAWIISALLHAGLLAWSVVWLTHLARFHVESGRTSAEMEITITAAPVPVVQAKASPAATAVPPQPQALPLIKAVTVSKPVKPTDAPESERVHSPPTSVAVSAKPRPPRSAAKPRTVPTRETTSASKGAIQAQPPEYPDESRIAREQGVVILRVEVTAAGEPAKVGILRSSGFFRLDQAARRAVMHWKFHPALMAGIPVSSVAEVPVRFKLQ
jgi:protein TonB